MLTGSIEDIKILMTLYNCKSNIQNEKKESHYNMFQLKQLFQKLKSREKSLSICEIHPPN